MANEKITLQNLTSNLYRSSFKRDDFIILFGKLRPDTRRKEALTLLKGYERSRNNVQSFLNKNIFSSKLSFLQNKENKVLFPEYVARTLVQAMVEYPCIQISNSCKNSYRQQCL